MNLSLVASAFALGATLGLLPGPVQFLLLTEASRGGMRRGFAAMAGANGTFGLLLVIFAGGVAFMTPGPTFLRVLQAAGGLFLLLLAADGFITSLRASFENTAPIARGMPMIRGALAVVLNPGAWVFLATTASSLFATGVRSGGRSYALALAVFMLVGIACVDGPMVLLGGGMRRFERLLTQVVTPLLALALAGFGIVLIVHALRG